MKATLVVAAREIAERKILFLGALVMGILPLFFPLVPGLMGSPRAARTVAVVLITAAITVAFPIAFGATILVGDIAQKRLAFYFSRPLPSASIWGGKILGALLISAVCALLTAAPVYLVEGDGVFSTDTGGLASRGFLSLALPGVLMLFLAAHAAASIARLKSAWIVPDFLLTAFFAVVFWFLLRSLVLAGFWDIGAMTYPPNWFSWWVFLPLAAVLLVASYVQVADGRTDAGRSHGALSATLWGVLTLLALPLGGLAWWVNAATPKDLGPILDLHLAPRGTWVRLAGDLRARGSASSSFLYDTDSGRFLKLPSWRLAYSANLAFSADGKRAAWREANPGLFERKRTIQVVALDSDGTHAIDTHVEMKPWAQIAISPSGRRLAVWNYEILEAYEVPDSSNPRQILALRANGGRRTVEFLDEDRIRLLPLDVRGPARPVASADVEIEEISLSSKKSLVTGRLEPGAFKYVRASADGRYLVTTNSENRLTLHDARTGAFVATLSEDLEAPKIRFVSGDRLVVAGVADGKGRLKIFLEGGTSRSDSPSAVLVDLGPAASLLLGGEIAPGRVSVALNPFRRNDERSRRAWKLAFVNVATGAVSPGPDGLVPADQFSWWFSPTLPPAEAGSPSSRLFLDADSRLVRLDPATGTETVLLGRSR